MNWLLFAFSGPVLWALSTHIDKYLVERYFKHGNVAVLLIFTSLIGIVMLPFIAFYRPGVVTLDVHSILLVVLSGLLYMAAMHFYLEALQHEEASVVVPYFQVTPLFGAVLAYLLLGETLSHRQLGGGGLIILGATLLSLRLTPHHHGYKLRLLLLMLACAFAFALSSVIFAAFAIRDEFWTTAFWTYTGEAIYGAALLAIGPVRREFAASLRTNTGAVLSINAVNEVINLGGGLCARYALLLAPLGLVQAIGSTTPLFVFLFGMMITLLLPRFGRENLAAGNLVQKGLSAILIVSGVILISA